MIVEGTSPPNPRVTCISCEACCCRLEAMLFNDSDVPEKFIETDASGRKSMVRLKDSWCAALDRDTRLCTIYRKRPWICREFEMGGADCMAVRAAPAQADSWEKTIEFFKK